MGCLSPPLHISPLLKYATTLTPSFQLPADVRQSVTAAHLQQYGREPLETNAQLILEALDGEGTRSNDSSAADDHGQQHNDENDECSPGDGFRRVAHCRLPHRLCRMQ